MRAASVRSYSNPSDLASTPSLQYICDCMSEEVHEKRDSCCRCGDDRTFFAESMKNVRSQTAPAGPICKLVLVIAILFSVKPLLAQMTMPGMAAMENSVGYLSSGTSIEPRAVSEFAPMIHTSLGNWTLMFHGNVFILETQQTGPRGFDKFFSTNWLMPMVARDFGRQTVMLRTMLSLEPATITQRRYPELFQTGETAYGLPIVDGQHQHDLLNESAGHHDG